MARLLCAAVWWSCAALAAAETFLMGYLTGSQRRPDDKEYTRPGRAISGAMNLALYTVSRHRPLVNGHQLDFVVAETYGSEKESIRQVVRLWNMNVSAIIGPQETCEHEGRLAASLNLAMISYFCTNSETSDKKLFPTFARTRPPDTQISKSLLSLLLSYNWMQVAFLYKDSPDSELGAIGERIVSVLRRGGVSLRHVVTWNQTFHVGYMDNPFTEILRRTKDDVRIYVVLGKYFEHRALLMTLQEQNLLHSGEYFVVGVDIQRYESTSPSKYLRTLFKEEEPTDPKAEEAFKYYVGVIGSPTIGFEVLTKKVNEFMELPPFNYTNILRQYGAYMKIRSEAAYLYDAVHLYAWSLNETLKAGGDPRNGTEIIARLLRRTYSSAMGYLVYMDEHGDAEGNYTLIHRRRVDGQVGLYPAGVFQLRANGTDLPELVISQPIQWPDGQPPIDEPPCGFRGEHCVSYTREIASGIVGGVVLVLVVIGLVFYRNWQYEQELDSLLWKIDYKEIQMNDGSADVKPLVNDSLSRMVLRSSQVSLSSNYDKDFRYSALYTVVGIYKGRMVAIKDIKRKTIDITRHMKKELKKMRDLRHDNLNPFIGACVDPPHLCTVSDYCTRGSLRDILENANVKLDNMFIASMVFDIVRGMVFLHDSPLRYHGNLKTTNCLVDSRWVVKVADFGLGAIINRAEEHLETEKDVRQKCEDLLFKAPEVLRSTGQEMGSQKADLYSFAMVLYEIHSRSPPFSGMGLGPLELLQSVIKRSSNNNPVFRPPIHMLDTCFDCVRTVLAECWAEEPENRPDFKTVRNRLRPMRKGMKPHIFDNMISMMEKYTNNLEVLVDERTNQLIVEKKKTEALLHEMLPRYVADQLKRGRSVQAESFDSVTIYFSDIVGFTSMSAESTPLQVVDFLNDLYTCFDSIIDNYDVYKVETIGDAYMVVSGLPVRNGLQHAGEVASMSLHLLEAIRRFTIRHRPQDTLMLRIGIHTGPVCAGVVGRKMPRYCLYGDTVNTASRMESTGAPLRIHCSASCHAVLVRLGGYQLEERGITHLKGKGDVVTYWLVGEDAKRQARRLQNKAKLKAQNQIRALRSRSGMERTHSLESARRLRFESDLRGDRRQTTRSTLDAVDCACADVKRRSCPCIHELEDDRDEQTLPGPTPGGDLAPTLGGDADWLSVVVSDYASRSDSALYGGGGARPDPENAASDFTESEPLLATPADHGETQI